MRTQNPKEPLRVYLEAAPPDLGSTPFLHTLFCTRFFARRLRRLGVAEACFVVLFTQAGCGGGLFRRAVYAGWVRRRPVSSCCLHRLGAAEACFVVCLRRLGVRGYSPGSRAAAPWGFAFRLTPAAHFCPGILEQGGGLAKKKRPHCVCGAVVFCVSYGLRGRTEEGTPGPVTTGTGLLSMRAGGGSVSVKESLRNGWECVIL